jgi:hypothetical protein
MEEIFRFAAFILGLLWRFKKCKSSFSVSKNVSKSTAKSQSIALTECRKNGKFEALKTSENGRRY